MLDIPSFADLNLAAASPVLFLALFTTVLLLIDVLFIPKERKSFVAGLTMVALIIAFILNTLVWNDNQETLLGMFIADEFTAFMNLTMLIGAMISILLSVDYLNRSGIESSEFYTLLLFSLSGMMLMGSANNLVMIFVALELLSIPLYVMAAMRRKDAKSEEAGMKYFIMGAFSSAFLLYGSALVYGATGSTQLSEIFTAVEGISRDSSEIWYLLVGTGMMIVGLGFKIGVVPFHMWTPDVYEGAPTPVTAFMSVGAKAGGFAALLRIVTIAFPTLTLDAADPAAWQTVVSVLAVATMILGNIVAVSQSNIKRMLAYSSIAHAGYIMIAIAAIGSGDAGIAVSATQAALVYLLAYTFTNLGAFAVVLAVEKDDGTGTEIEDFVGLAKSKPLLAAMMAFFMLSLTGIPLTAGFTGKWLIFKAAMDADLILVSVIGVLTSVASAFYYVRVIVNMYLRDGEGDPAIGATTYVMWGTMTAFAGTLLLGIFPSLALNLLESMTSIGVF